jgi:hypothetical protein
MGDREWETGEGKTGDEKRETGKEKRRPVTGDR